MDAVISALNSSSTPAAVSGVAPQGNQKDRRIYVGNLPGDITGDGLSERIGLCQCVNVYLCVHVYSLSLHPSVIRYHTLLAYTNCYTIWYIDGVCWCVHRRRITGRIWYVFPPPRTPDIHISTHMHHTYPSYTHTYTPYFPLLINHCFGAVNSAMLACGGVPDGVTTAVLSTWLAPEKKYAFLELCSSESAAVCLGLNGINCMGSSLRIARPKTYQETPVGLF